MSDKRDKQAKKMYYDALEVNKKCNKKNNKMNGSLHWGGLPKY